MSKRIIVTEYICPPIPIRSHDWQAVFDGYDLDDPIGHGPSEGEAIINLMYEWMLKEDSK